mgnify:CR=1 FL=1
MNSETLHFENGSFRVLLCDNGSVSPVAIRTLRDLAKVLGQKLNRPVQAVGLLHSDRADAELPQAGQRHMDAIGGGGQGLDIIDKTFPSVDVDASAAIRQTVGFLFRGDGGNPFAGVPWC